MIDCVHQTGLEREYILQYVTLTLGVYRVEVRPNEQYCWDMLLSQQMLDVIIASFITILSFSKTMHQCILHSPQSNCWSAKLNFLSPELLPNNSP